MLRKIISMLLCLVMCLSVISASAATAPTFTMTWIEGKTEKEVLVNGEKKVIYCMQYDNLLPITQDGYAASKTVFWEASPEEHLVQDPTHAMSLRRLLYAGYPYDSKGLLAPLYNAMGSYADSFAADLTQNVLWSLMKEWGITGNEHYDAHQAEDAEIPGWNAAYTALLEYVHSGEELPAMPASFTPHLTGSTEFAAQGQSYMTGALSISNPTGFKLGYNIKLPEGVVPLNADKEEIMADYVYEGGQFKNNGYTVYGGETFYLKTDDVSAAAGKTMTIKGDLSIPANITQYSTSDKAMGWKEWDGYTPGGQEKYELHDFQTMLSSGIESKSFSASATLNEAPKFGSLSITKNLTGNDFDDSKEFTFTIKIDDASVNGTYNDVVFTNGVGKIDLACDETKTINGLPDGAAYTVTEDDYSAEGYTVKSKSGDTGTISESGVSAVVFTNERNTYGNLVISKTVSGNAVDPDKDFNFTVTLDDTSISGTYGDLTFDAGVATFTLKGGESKTAENLPNNVGYKVTEDDYSADGYETTMDNDEGEIAGNETITVTFTNKKDAAPTPAPEPTPTPDPSQPHTGDSSNFTLWKSLMLVSGFTFALAAVYFFICKTKIKE